MMNFSFLHNPKKLKRVKRLTIITTLVLFVAIGICVAVLSDTFNMGKKISNQQQEYYKLGVKLAAASDYLTNQARNYVQFGDKMYMDNYWQEVYQRRTRDEVLTQLRELRVPAGELVLMIKAKSYSDSLISTEYAAMKAAQAGNFKLGRELMFNRHYNDQKMLIMNSIAEYQRTIDNSMAWHRQLAIEEENHLIILLNVLIFLTFALVYCSMLLHGIQMDEKL